MNGIQRTKQEYGGFLPLELNPGREMFVEYEPHLLRFNSVKASLNYIIKMLLPKKIYLPYYYCPSTIEAIKNIGVEIQFYHITDSLMPELIEDEDESIVLLVDYFGVKANEIIELARNYRRANIVIDNAHSFYSKPIFAENIYNVYSAKKFFGIPDGSYAVGKKILSEGQRLSSSESYAKYLFTTYEKGTNVAYSMKKEADQIIASKYENMSLLSVGLLQNVDYERVKRQRALNYETLHQAFRDINELVIPETCPAYQYPLLISRIGNAIKHELVKNKIFVSTLWSGHDLLENGTTFELNMSENAIFLPIDQRYSKMDMKYLAKTVVEIKDKINGKKT